MNFITKEVTFSIHEYSLAKFRKLNINNSVDEWMEDLVKAGS